MIPIKPIVLEAFRTSHTRATVINVFNGAKLVSDPKKPLAISDGSVTVDRYQKARRSLTCTVPLTQWQDIPAMDVLQTRLQVFVGYDLGGQYEVLPVGVFRVNELGRSSDGALSISGTSLESYVIDNNVLEEHEYAYAGDNCIDSIKRLITACFPASEPPEFEVTPEAQALADVTMSTDLTVGDRWELIESYAWEIECDVYCAPSGAFRIARTPLMETGKPVWKINEGADGVLVSMGTNVSRDKLFNGVQVIVQNSDSAVPPITGKMITVADLPDHPMNLPDHPMYGILNWGGPFGKKPYIYIDNSGKLGSPEACNDKAKTLLLGMLAEERTLDLSAIPNPALEPDDIIKIVRYHPVTGEEIVEMHMLTNMTIPLGLGEWTAGTLSNRTKEPLLNESPLKPPKDEEASSTAPAPPEEEVRIDTDWEVRYPHQDRGDGWNAPHDWEVAYRR